MYAPSFRLRIVRIFNIINQVNSQDVAKKNLPDTPGVYFFLGKRGAILYIGKATSLKDRVRSYFNADLLVTRSPLIVQMIDEATDIKWEETDSVLEALVLESNLIKKHQPKYNTQAKDNKSFNYVVVTDEDFPRVYTLREREILEKKLKDTIKYSFGPYPSGGQLREALRILRKIFPFRDQKSKNPHSERFYKQLGLAPDTGDSKAKKEYQKTIRHIQLFFQGKKSKLLKQLEKEMKQYAKEQMFEKANERKKQIFALTHIRDVSLIKSDPGQFLDERQARSFRIESYDIAHLAGDAVVGVFTVVEDGEAQRGEYRKFNIRRNPGVNDTGALQEVLERRLNHTEWPLPRLIVVDGGKAQVNVMNRTLRESGLAIPVVGVVKDEKHRAREIIGDAKFKKEKEREIVLSNSEAHRFAISFHRKKLRSR